MIGSLRRASSSQDIESLYCYHDDVGLVAEWIGSIARFRRFHHASPKV